MTNDELHKNWQDYGVQIAGEVRPLKDHYCICWGWIERYKGLLFDVGGEQGAPAAILRVDENDNLVAVNPENTDDISILGKLELLNASAS
jgi:hypothetical protein